jgi:hypothetical protein
MSKECCNLFQTSSTVNQINCGTKVFDKTEDISYEKKEVDNLS